MKTIINWESTISTSFKEDPLGLKIDPDDCVGMAPPGERVKIIADVS